jgi:Na+/proline symporter
MRFGKFASVLAGLFTWLAETLIAASYIVSMQFMLDVYFGIGKILGFLLAVIIVCIYCYFGGLHAGVRTDFLQGILTAIGVALLAIGSIQAVQTLGGFNVEVLGEKALHLSPSISINSTLEMIWVVGAPLLGATFASADSYVRMFAAKNVKNAQIGGVVGGSLYLLFGLLVTIIGVAGIALVPDLANSEHVLPAIAMKVFSPLFASLFLIAIMAVLMSSSDSVIIAASSNLVRNVYMPIFYNSRKVTEKRLFHFSQMAVIFTSACVVFFAYISQVILLLIVLMGSIYLGYLASIFVMGLFWKKANEIAANVTLVASVIFCGIWYILSYGIDPIIFKTAEETVRFSNVAPEIISFPAGIILIVIISLITQKSCKPKKIKTIPEYFEENLSYYEIPKI